MMLEEYNHHSSLRHHNPISRLQRFKNLLIFTWGVALAIPFRALGAF
jgi:hypothetical protein